MREILLLLLGLTVNASIAIALVALVRAHLRRRYGAAFAYGAWYAVALVVLVSLLPGGAGAPDAVPASGVALWERSLAGVVAQATPTIAAGLVWTWLGGAVAVAMALLLAQARFVRSLGVRAQRNGVSYAQRRDVSPMVVGCLRPSIVVPADFDTRYTPEEQDLILAHERTHVRRGDLIANGLWSALRCLLWFNPLPHLATARFRFDQELACDAAVLRSRLRSRKTYATAMLKSEGMDARALLSSAWRDARPLTERIRSLWCPTVGERRRTAAHAVVALFLCVLAAGAWGARPGVLAPAAPGATPPVHSADPAACPLQEAQASTSHGAESR
jgi:bla regulator protein blaR1